MIEKFVYKIFQIKCPVIFLLVVMMGVTGCSVLDSAQPAARSLPKTPQIKPQTIVRPRYTRPRKVPDRIVVPRVKKYPARTSKPLNKEQQAAARKLLIADAKKRATVDVDPYASIPENSSVSGKQPIPKSKNTGSSPAVKSLMVSARADILTGRTKSAVSKLERGLRIESQNPQLWYLLAKAHYIQSNYQQTISMAKKSIHNTANDELIAQNWKLIKQAGERSGDTTAIKEALDYVKLNP